MWNERVTSSNVINFLINGISKWKIWRKQHGIQGQIILKIWDQFQPWIDKTRLCGREEFLNPYDNDWLIGLPISLGQLHSLLIIFRSSFKSKTTRAPLGICFSIVLRFGVRWDGPVTVFGDRPFLLPVGDEEEEGKRSDYPVKEEDHEQPAHDISEM